MCMFCCLTVEHFRGRVLVREGDKNRHFFPVRTYKIALIQRDPGNRPIHSRRKKNIETTLRELQRSDRAQISTTGSGRHSCVDVLYTYT